MRRLVGRSMDLPYRTRTLPLAGKIASLAGRVDYVRVVVRAGAAEPIAVSGASILSTTTRADGFVQGGLSADYYLTKWAYLGAAYSVMLNSSSLDGPGMDYTKQQIFGRLGLAY
jgi:hypothetical protein